MEGARRIALAVAAAAVVTATFVLGAAAMDMPFGTTAGVMLALAAVWIPQTLIFAARRRR